MTSEPPCNGCEDKRFSNDFNWRKFENLIPYHTLHCGSEVIGFTAIFKWSCRSAVVDHADIVVLLLLIEVEWRKKKQQPK